MRVVFTPSQHFSGRGMNQDNTLWGSWAVYLNEHALYFSGDGGYSSEFSEIGDKYGPFDIAFIEAGQYDEAWADVHMFPEQTVQAALDLKVNTLLPIHNTKFVLALHGWDEPLEDVTMEGQRRNVNVTTPMLGVTFLLNENMPSDTWWRNVSIYEPPMLKTNSLVGAMMYTSMLASAIMIRLGSKEPRVKLQQKYED
jgi:L-ascorbate metabolism protein UlaG (beta-lactamase superfamily)